MRKKDLGMGQTRTSFLDVHPHTHGHWPLGPVPAGAREQERRGDFGSEMLRVLKTFLSVGHCREMNEPSQITAAERQPGERGPSDGLAEVPSASP